MIIGVPKEIKVHEYRVGIVPGGVATLSEEGHALLIEKGAGAGAGYSDDEYRAAGARIVDSADRVFAEAELIAKVKEPQASEVPLFKKGQILLCYLHLAPLPELTRSLMDAGVNAIALETIQTDDGNLPCLTPMSEIAGRMSVQVGARCLEREFGGSGILISGAPGVAPATVTIIGAGTAGSNAARVAVGMGARVMIMDIDIRRLARIDELYQGRVRTVMSDRHNIREMVAQSDVLIGAVLVTGARAPTLVTEEMIKSMRPGSVIIDIAVDQGGCVATCRPTTHDQPTYKVHEVIHYCVPNMPGAVPRTSTQALTNATLPWLRRIAGRGLKTALAEYQALVSGLNIYCPQGQTRGVLTCRPVAEALGLEWKSYQ